MPHLCVYFVIFFFCVLWTHQKANSNEIAWRARKHWKGLTKLLFTFTVQHFFLCALSSCSGFMTRMFLASKNKRKFSPFHFYYFCFWSFFLFVRRFSFFCCCCCCCSFACAFYHFSSVRWSWLWGDQQKELYSNNINDNWKESKSILLSWWKESSIEHSPLVFAARLTRSFIFHHFLLCYPLLTTRIWVVNLSCSSSTPFNVLSSVQEPPKYKWKRKKNGEEDRIRNQISLSLLFSIFNLFFFSSLCRSLCGKYLFKIKGVLWKMAKEIKGKIKK